jgi:hypothetical protein
VISRSRPAVSGGDVQLTAESEVLRFRYCLATESAGEKSYDETHMFKHAEYTMAANPKL